MKQMTSSEMGKKSWTGLTTEQRAVRAKKGWQNTRHYKAKKERDRLSTVEKE